MTIMRKLLITFALVALSGCATDINRRNAETYYASGLRAEAGRNWAGAYEAYRRALINARSGHASPAFLSAATYNLGRMAGYTCKYDEAEQLLLESLRLEQGVPRSQPGNMTKRWSELARLYESRAKYQDSAAFYARSVPELERLGFLEEDPIGFADYLESYARVLEASGKGDLATAMTQRATSLRAKNPGKYAKFTPVTYNDACGKAL